MLKMEVSATRRYSADVERFERELRTSTTRLVARLADKHGLDLNRVQFTKPKR